MKAPLRQPGLPRTTVVAGFYGTLAALAFVAHSMSQETNDVWRLDPLQSLGSLLWTPLIGVAFGLVVVRLFRLLESRQSWISTLHHELQHILGKPSMGELILLAGVSSVGEELFFRGFLLDVWGIWLSSLVFALLHIPPRLQLWPWTLSSFFIGIAFAALSLWTGNLGAAIAAHFVINVQNLYYITRNMPYQARLRSFESRVQQLDEQA